MAKKKSRYPEDPIVFLIELQSAIKDETVSTAEAKETIYYLNRATWRSKWWKSQRAKLIKDFCEICGSDTPPMTLQHTWHPRKLKHYVKDVIRQNQSEGEEPGWKVEKAKIDAMTDEELYAIDAHLVETKEGYSSQLRKMCPDCNRMSIRYRKTDSQHICQRCKTHWDYTDLVNSSKKIRMYLKKQVWKNSQQAYYSALEDVYHNPPKEALIEYINDSLQYLSLEDTITACKSCAYRQDTGILCIRCKQKYHPLQFSVCYDCWQEEQAGKPE